jgi:hypothetical protein
LARKKPIWLLGLGFKRVTKKKGGSSKFDLTYAAKKREKRK